MKELIHNILGTPYKIQFGKKKKIDMEEVNMGECRIYSKEIKVATDKEDCREDELRARLVEVVAHEVFHAYVNEAGLDLEPEVEELMCTFYMKNWRKLSNSVLQILDETGLLDN